tara:strand:- start:386 stop:589 length:204 start_codon:yes stop_codon:yes gene_type:complete
MKYISGLFLFTLFLSSCGGKCKTCTLVLNEGGTITKSSMGEFCDDELKLYDGEECVTGAGTCEFVCE